MKVTRSHIWGQCRGLVTRNTHTEYESFIVYGVNDMTKVKVGGFFWSKTDSRGIKICFDLKFKFSMKIFLS